MNLPRTSLMCHLLLIGMSACSHAPLQAPAIPDRPEPVISDPALNCSSLITVPGAINVSALSNSGWVLVQYRLDGSGRAQQVEVLDSYRAKDVAKHVVSLVRTHSYRQGERRERCQEVIAYRAVRD